MYNIKELWNNVKGKSGTIVYFIKAKTGLLQLLVLYIGRNGKRDVTKILWKWKIHNYC